MQTTNAVTSARRQLVLATIITAYQAEFEARRPLKDMSFGQHVAVAIAAVGINRSADPAVDLVDITRVHVSAHDEWFAGAHKNRREGMLFREFLAEQLIGAGFGLDALRVAV